MIAALVFLLLLSVAANCWLLSLFFRVREIARHNARRFSQVLFAVLAVAIFRELTRPNGE